MLYLLSLEIILLLHKYLPDWNDRLRLPSLHPALWSASLNLRVDETYDLETEHLNTLQLACSKRIKLPESRTKLSLLHVLIQYSYAANEFIIPAANSTSTHFAKWMCSQVGKRSDHKEINLVVDLRFEDTWRKIAEGKDVPLNIVTTGAKRNLADIDLDRYETPREAKRIKDHYKGLAVLAGTCRLRLGNDIAKVSDKTYKQEILLPFGVLSATEGEYVRDIFDANKDERLSPTHNMQTDEANQVAKELIERYLEAVIIFGQHWMMLTSIDCFFHSRPSLDDCADASNIEFARFAEAKIQRKTKYGKEYYEVSLFVGNIELLAVGGLYGQDVQPSKTAFLGSSLRTLPIALQKPRGSSVIYIRKHSVHANYSNRHLRQYGKVAAGYNWSGHSGRFVSRGLYPVNPMQYMNHTVASTGISIATQLVSFFFTCASAKSVSKDDIARMLTITCTDTSIRKVLKNQKAASFEIIEERIRQENGQVSQLMKVAIKGLMLLEKRAGKGTAALLPILQEMKDTCIEMMDTGYAAKLKAANAHVVRSYIINSNQCRDSYTSIYTSFTRGVRQVRLVYSIFSAFLCICFIPLSIAFYDIFYKKYLDLHCSLTTENLRSPARPSISSLYPARRGLLNAP